MIFLGKTGLEEFENWSDCELDSCARVRVVPDVIDVLVSPSSVVTEFCDVSSMCSDGKFVEPQSFFSPKSVHDTQEETRYEGSPVKAPPLSRRRMTPPTLVKNSYPLFERRAGALRCGRLGMECEGKNAHSEDKTVSGKKPQCEGAS